MASSSASTPNATLNRSADEYLALYTQDRYNAPLALYTGAALHAEGRLEEALAVWTFGDDANPVLRTIRLHPQADEAMRTHSALADQCIRAHFTGMHREGVEAAEAQSGEKLPRLHRAVWTHYHQGRFEFGAPLHRPQIFYLPDLPATPTVAPETVPGFDHLLDAFPAICAEYEAAMTQGAQGTPYVHAGMDEEKWTKLRGSHDWEAIYLYLNAEETADTARFPKTIEALSSIRLVEKRGKPMEAFFSVLKPGAHIPPHFGLTNSRMTVHMPLIVPSDCAIRVGESTHQWQPGEAFLFDDSFEHEAWNKSEETRVVLIFEVPHPDLSDLEQETITQIYERFDAWVASRFSILGVPADPPRAGT
ncbi:MAG: aspartyl/asparaginyl beta-hydroxylase domain-containing protein [Pseudomonadota bacterium]